MKQCIILANGKPPSKQVIEYFIRNKNSVLFCADGGANSALKLNLEPKFIIGDLDSVHESTLLAYKDRVKVIKLKRQNDTDVEKCLKEAIKLKFREAILTGVTGNRLDHTFCNLGIAIKFFEKITVKIIAENSFLTVLNGFHKIKTIPGETISIFGISEQTTISSKGLKYPLKNKALPFGRNDGTSNIALGEFIELNVIGGVIFLVRDFNIMKKHGLI
ncbi:MAG: thiamine diphosphokinase [Ignavibacteriaceae bacterium]|nr:thiamine diphosphokinase [Ignavibacteriaceae bacterium]